MPNLKNLLIIFIAPFIWSLNIILMKNSSEFISMELFNILRFLSLLPCIFFMKWPINFIKISLVSILWLALNFYFQGKAINSGIDPSYLALGNITTFIFSIIFAYLITKEQFKSISMLGCAISLIGIVFIALDNMENWGRVAGLSFVLLSNFFVALGITFLKRFDIAPTMQNIVWMCVSSSLISVFLGIVDLGLPATYNQLTEIRIQTVISILFSSYLSLLVGGYIWVKVIKIYGTVFSNFVILFTPLFTFLLGYIFFDESFTLFKALSITFIGSGFMIASQIGLKVPSLIFNSKKLKLNERY